MNTNKPFEQFRNQFREICTSHSGTFSARDTIGEGSAYLIPTPWGTLRASIHCIGWENRKRTRAIEEIFLQWRDYSGPKDFPLHGDFNRFSHKWNIMASGGNLLSVRAAVLSELTLRLEMLGEITSPIIPIADLYADLIAAVNLGDIGKAQTLAAQIAA